MRYIYLNGCTYLLYSYIYMYKYICIFSLRTAQCALCLSATVSAVLQYNAYYHLFLPLFLSLLIIFPLSSSRYSPAGWQCPDFACRQCPLFRAPFLNCYFLSLWFFAFVFVLLIRWLSVVTVASRQWRWCCGQRCCKSKLCNERKVWKCLIIAQWG